MLILYFSSIGRCTGFSLIKTNIPGYFAFFSVPEKGACSIHNSKLTWLSESTHSSLRCRDHLEYKLGHFPEKFCECPVDTLKLHFSLKEIEKNKIILKKKI